MLFPWIFFQNTHISTTNPKELTQHDVELKFDPMLSMNLQHADELMTINPWIQFFTMEGRIFYGTALK